MYYKVHISNVTSHEFYYAEGVLPMHKIVCDIQDELLGLTETQATRYVPGPEKIWAEIQENGYIWNYKEDELSYEPKPGYHYRHVMSGMIILDKAPEYLIDVPTPFHYEVEADAKDDNTDFGFFKYNSKIYLCAFAEGQSWNSVFDGQRVDLSRLPAVYTYDEFKALPYIAWQQTKAGIDTFWLDADSFEPCEKSFDELLADLPDIAIPENQNKGSFILIDNEAYRIEEEPDSDREGNC